MAESAAMTQSPSPTPREIVRAVSGVCRCGRPKAAVQPGVRGPRPRFCERCRLFRRATSYYRRGGRLMEQLWAMDEEGAGG